MSWRVTYSFSPRPEFYSVAIFTAIGDNFTAMFTCYFKAADINPTSDPLLVYLRGDLDYSRLLTSAVLTRFWIIHIACNLSGFYFVLLLLNSVLI